MTDPVIRSAGIAGLAYFAIAFAAGFALGTVRVLVLVPALGESAAVLLELPVILTVSWLACRWAIKRFAVADSAAARCIMGGLAFALLIAAELVLGVWGFGRSMSEQMARYERWPELMGLAGQLLFAAFPYMQLLKSRSIR